MSAAVSLVDHHVDDVTTIRAYAVVCCDAATLAREELDTMIDALVASRDAADAALERCRQACELAERMSVFGARAAAGDVEPATLAEAAAAIRALRGDR